MEHMSPAAYLHTQLTQQGIPIYGVSGPPWSVQYDPSATQAQRTQGDQIASNFDGLGRKGRPLYEIFQDIAGLTTTQQTNIWNDLVAAVPGKAPRKYLTDEYDNAASIFVMDYVIFQIKPTGPALIGARNEIIAMWTQDYPFYLLNPPFDPSISVPGGDPYQPPSFPT